ncbi:MAG: hypothetical protein LBK54_01620 [Propionibacteriaceae bacterium]|jgi:hypothetical protein|nr:hypothetical protein [Propionibacteriaceae bacterium]
MGIDWTALGVIVAAVIGLAGAVTAVIQARQANKAAKAANQASAQAVREAAEANRLADEANQIAKAARGVAERQLRLERDIVQYAWQFETDEMGFPVAITNHGPSTAFQVSIRVTVDERPALDLRQEKVPGFGQVTLDLATARDEHTRKVRDQPWDALSQMYPGINRRIPVTVRFRAWIDCVTADQSPRQQIIDHVARHHENEREIVRLPLKKT